MPRIECLNIQENFLKFQIGISLKMSRKIFKIFGYKCLKNTPQLTQKIIKNLPQDT